MIIPRLGKQLLLVLAFAIGTMHLLAQTTLGQSQSLYTVAFRSLSLNEALAEFSQLTGTGVTFDPALIDTQRTTCIINKSLANEVLKCILEDTGLDYILLSSGTYVITKTKEQKAIYGTIAGDVRDIRSGQPLANAHIMLASATDQISTVSNLNGQFTLPPLLPGRYYLSSTHLGYHDTIDTLIVVPGRHTFREITMQVEPIVFTPVVIDGIQRNQSTESLDHAFLLLSDSMMVGQLSSSESITQQVASVPGVRVNDLTADAHLQGSDSGEHQFKLDGVPIFLPQRAIGILGPFSPFAFESITIHKTGFGVHEGSYLAGVVAARHKLSEEEGIDIQADPLSLNGRFVGGIDLKSQKKLEFMTALRTSFWDMYEHPQLQTTLNKWSRPDPFLIFGPIARYDEIDPSFFEEALNVESIPTTSVSFTDLHVAGELTLSPFSAVNFSGFSGSNNFKGFLPGLFSTASDTLVFGDVPPDFNGQRESITPLSVDDQYKWLNRAGQINYHTLIGRHTLFNIQGRASTYELSQNYKLVDGLSDIINEQPDSEDAFIGDPVYEFPIRQLEETNSVLEYAVEARLEHAFTRHFVTGGIELTHTESTSDILLPSLLSDFATANLNSSALVAGVERIAYNTSVNRAAAYVQDRIDLSRHLSAEIGSRFTYFFSDGITFVEPRAAIRFDGRLKNGGTFSSRTATGIYRQYLLQFDVSTLNAGTLFPSKRIWIPVDFPIRPPLAFHFSQSFLIAPTKDLTFRVEGYAKLLQRTYTVNFIPSPGTVAQVSVQAANEAANTEFIPQAKSLNLGTSVSLKWQHGPFFTQVIYDFSSIRRRAPELFENNWTTVPWNEPHRLNVTFQVEPMKNLIFSSRFTGVWGRSWGFRQAYYDYFGHRSTTRLQPPFDFGKPEEHVLPAIYQVDLGLAYNAPLKNTRLQFRLDLINALDRKNVADWRLLWKDGSLEKDNRYLYPRIPSVALRLGL